MAEKAKKKVKRLKGVALGNLRAATKKFQKVQKELEDFREKYREDNNLYKDQVAWPQELVFDRDAEKVGKEDRIVIGRIPMEVLKEQAKIIERLKQADEEVAAVRDKYATMMGVSPFALDIFTGIAVIEDGETIYEDVDLEEPQKEKAESDFFDED